MRNSIVTSSLSVLLLLLVSLVGCDKDKDKDKEPDIFNPTPYNIEIPPGFPQMLIPADNPTTVEGVALGRRLFHDNVLSRDFTQSCASCHNQAFSFTDNGRKLSTGIDGIEGTRNSMALVNLGFNRQFFWDGRAKSLEIQALEPVPNPIEMHLPWIEAEQRLNANANYKTLFKKAFNTDYIDSMHVAKALAQFMRTMISANSKFDKRMRFEVNFTPSEANGFVIFNTERGDCFHCHSLDGGRLLTDNMPHNNGLDATFTDLGVGAITGNPNDYGKFITPTLRNIELTAPYMHDGRFQTLEEVIDHYNNGGQPSPTIDPLMKFVGEGLNLTLQEKADLLAFLKTLTDTSFVNNSKFKSPM
jgi:cytochrome c peroxidase